MSFGGLGVVGDVADDQATVASIGQRFAQNDVDLEDGLWTQSASAVPSPSREQLGAHCVFVFEPTSETVRDFSRLEVMRALR